MWGCFDNVVDGKRRVETGEEVKKFDFQSQAQLTAPWRRVGAKVGDPCSCLLRTVALSSLTPQLSGNAPLAALTHHLAMDFNFKGTTPCPFHSLSLSSLTPQLSGSFHVAALTHPPPRHGGRRTQRCSNDLSCTCRSSRAVRTTPGCVAAALSPTLQR